MESTSNAQGNNYSIINNARDRAGPILLLRIRLLLARTAVRAHTLGM
jgi:hypothetical protein